MPCLHDDREKLIDDRRGVTSVEYAVILGILALMIAGVFPALATKLTTRLSALVF